jgi:phosphoglycerate dehydrogenase-like enzyme
MQVIFHYPAGPDLTQRLYDLAEFGIEVTIVLPEENTRFTDLLQSSEVLWHALQPVTEEHILQAPNLRLIQKVGIGVDTIDIDAAKEAGIAVCNLPGTNSHAVAELAVALMLAVLRKIPVFDGETRRGEGWKWPTMRQGSLGEIGGRTVGLVGYGAVPRQLAPILLGFGAKIVYCDIQSFPDAVGTRLALEELLTISDIVSLHLPLTESTHHIIDRSSISLMKKTGILINTARGGLVDQDALAEALESGQLAAAGLDTFSTEPVETNNPLLELDNLVVSPHIAWLTMETFDRSIEILVENCRRLSAGEDLLHRVA